jgi:hypothetical protein
MKPTNKIHTFLLLFALSAVVLTTTWSGCKKDDDEGGPCFDETNPACENYDPCWNRREPVSAEFEAGAYRVELDTWYPESSEYIVEGDTVQAGRYLKFTALDPDAETFEWTVGTDTRVWTDRSFYLLFPCDQVENQTLPVRLVVTRLSDTVCAPESVLRDTFTRHFYFVHLDKLAFMGVYEGQLDEYDLGSYQMTIRFRCRSLSPAACTCGNSFGSETVSFVNLLNEGCEKISNTYRSSYREVYAETVYTPLENAPWLTPEEMDCDLSVFGPAYVRDWVKGLHARLFADGDSIEVNFTHFLSPTINGVGSTSKKVRFRGKKLE